MKKYCRPLDSRLGIIEKVLQTLDSRLGIIKKTEAKLAESDWKMYEQEENEEQEIKKSQNISIWYHIDN